MRSQTPRRGRPWCATRPGTPASIHGGSAPQGPRPTLTQTLLSEASIKIYLYLGAVFVITAALFLRKFVTAKSWLHLDVFAWTNAAKPGRPEGGECQTARALYALIKKRYGTA